MMRADLWLLARWRKWRELRDLGLEVKALEGLLWAVREVDEVRGGAPVGSAVLLASMLINANDRLEERRRLP